MCMRGGVGCKKAQQHQQGFPHALGFTPHTILAYVGSDFLSSSANTTLIASVAKKVDLVSFERFEGLSYCDRTRCK